MITGSVDGRVELRHLQAILGEIPAKLREDLAKGTRTALAPLKKEIPAAERAYMPTRYGEVLAQSTKIATRVTAGDTLRATVKVSATGKSALRDVTAHNRGSLRHPVFGRYRRTRKGLQANPWKDQVVKPGMVDDPVEEARKRVVHNAEDARDRAADMILKG
jgi:hypothetical protein